MSKSFDEVFKEWVADNFYNIGDDVGWEFSDSLEAGPTPVDCSLTLEENGTTAPTEEILDCGASS